jgi:hypothetical protein
LVKQLPHCWPRSQRITCVNNLKQIGLSLKQWSLDAQDKFPFQVSTNAAGTRELCATGPDGFDSNSAMHFLVLSNELNTPLILLCPKDTARRAAADFQRLKPENVTYRLRSSPDVTDTNPGAIIAVCPLDGNTLKCDGTVIGEKPQPDPFWKPFVDLFNYDANVRRNTIVILYVAVTGLALVSLGIRLK